MTTTEPVDREQFRRTVVTPVYDERTGQTSVVLLPCRHVGWLIDRGPAPATAICRVCQYAHRDIPD